jgi:DNA-directed RNA polymerase I subunit RPA2
MFNVQQKCHSFIVKLSSLFISLFSISGITSFYDSQGNIKQYFNIKKSILNILIETGMTQSLPKIFLPGPPEVLTVLLDGCIVGFIPSTEVEKVVAHLRELKVSSAAVVCYVKISFVP